MQLFNLLLTLVVSNANFGIMGRFKGGGGKGTAAPLFSCNFEKFLTLSLTFGHKCSQNDVKQHHQFLRPPLSGFSGSALGHPVRKFVTKYVRRAPVPSTSEKFPHQHNVQSKQENKKALHPPPHLSTVQRLHSYRHCVVAEGVVISAMPGKKISKGATSQISITLITIGRNIFLLCHEEYGINLINLIILDQ